MSIVDSNDGSDSMRIYNKEDNEEEEKEPTLAGKLVTLASGYSYFFLNQYSVPFVSIAVNIKKPYDVYDVYGNFVTVHCPKLENINSTSNKHTVHKNTVNTVNTVSDVGSKKIVIMPLRSKRFVNWLAALSHKVLKETAGPGSVSSAVSTLEGLTQEKNIHHKLYNRVAPDPNGNGFWIDMCDDNWRVIHVTEEGWKIEDKTPMPMFQRRNQGPLTVPKKIIESEGAKEALKFLDFLNLRNDVDKLMAICSIISYFIPEIEHPILGVSGAHGSAKSMFFEIIKKIIDPLTKNPDTETISMSSDELGLAQQLSHIYFPCLIMLVQLRDGKVICFVEQLRVEQFLNVNCLVMMTTLSTSFVDV